ncbi:MAG: hypothetical protein QM783_06355 [Phycisphaerales bacterium]
MIRSCVVALAVGAAAPAFAQVSLMGWVNVDNVFTAYISTSPTDLGTPFMSGDSWPTTYTGNYVFPSAGTYYLHVLATDQGRPEMFIGTFELQNANGSTFSNGADALLTNTSNWVVSNTGVGMNTSAPLDLGQNGGGAWGNLPGQAPLAHFLWAPDYTPTVYFTTVINVVPTPGALVSLSLLGTAALRRRAR